MKDDSDEALKHRLDFLVYMKQQEFYCPVCLMTLNCKSDPETFSKNVLLLKCRHRIHVGCL